MHKILSAIADWIARGVASRKPRHRHPLIGRIVMNGGLDRFDDNWRNLAQGCHPQVTFPKAALQ